MNKLAFILFSYLLVCSSCVGTYVKPGPNPNEKDTWELLYTAGNKVLDLYPTPFELFAITDNEFLRFDADRALIEKRPLSTERPRYGKPVMSDNTFMRLILNGDNKQELQFSVVKNAAQVYKVLSTDLVNANETIFVDFDARFPGAYSADGQYFIVPAITYPNYHYEFFILKIDMNQQTTEINNISLFKRIPEPSLPADFGNIMSSRFIDGHFYVATKSGGYRVGLDGVSERLFNHWVLDFFTLNDKIYATSFEDYNMQVSEDNGLTWNRIDAQSKLKYCDTGGGLVFTQPQPGWRYQLADEGLTKAQDIDFNSTFTEDNDSYHAMDFFLAKYYVTVQKQIYFNSEVKVK